MLRLIALSCAALACAVTSAQAETYRMQYEAAILGVVVIGTADYQVTSNATRYGVRANVRTSGAARIFDQTEVNATTSGAIAGNVLNWARYDLSHAYARKSRHVTLTHTGSTVSAQVQPHYGNMGRPAATAAQQNASFDPLTGIFALGRSIAAAHACQGNVLVFDGRQHYRISVSPKSQGNFSSGGYTGPALICTMRYEPMAGFTLSPQERARIPTAEATFALPPRATFAAPLRVNVPTPVGQAQLDLRQYAAS